MWNLAHIPQKSLGVFKAALPKQHIEQCQPKAPQMDLSATLLGTLQTGCRFAERQIEALAVEQSLRFR
jgi:hypothetical protein